MALKKGRKSQVDENTADKSSGASANVLVEDVMKLESAEAGLQPGQSNAAEAGLQLGQSNAAEATITSTETTKSRITGASRSVSSMYKVKVNKAKGKRLKVTYNEYGIPNGSTRPTLQSYIGMLARTMVPIDIESWPKVKADLKKKIWEELQNTFKIAPESKSFMLKSTGVKWRQFKAVLTAKYVLPFIGEKKKLSKPPKKYNFVGRDVWRKFVAERIDPKWLLLHRVQSERVKKRKYPYRLSRKGYIGLQEEEIQSGALKLGETPDRAILWKKARIPKNMAEVDEDLAVINEKIDSLLDLKRSGEFTPEGSSDVLTAALQTPEHSGRVRGVGGYVNPTTFFQMPKGQIIRITKAELMARDRQRTVEAEKARQEFLAEITELKEMIKTRLADPPNIPSPKISSKASVNPKDEGLAELKTNVTVVKPLELDDIDCKVVEYPTEIAAKKDLIRCELAVDNIENKIAFGMVFTQPEMNVSIHGAPMKPGCLRVSVDGAIKADAKIPEPLGKIKRVYQAIGCHVAWPEEFIIYTKPAVQRKQNGHARNKSELQQVQSLFDQMKPNKNVPKQFKLLYKHVTTFMKATGASIQIPCDDEVFGCGKTIFLLHENVISLLEFEMVGQAAISTYMAYLHTVVRNKNELETFAMVDPGATYTLNSDFQSYMVNRLKEGNSDRLFFVPHNENGHWILTIIWDSEIYILDPLPQTHSYLEWEKALTSAIKKFNAETGRGNKIPPIRNLIGCPKQPGGMECGYVVMRYMREIIEDKDLSFATKWINKSRKSYTRDELDVVRCETLDYIQEHM